MTRARVDKRKVPEFSADEIDLVTDMFRNGARDSTIAAALNLMPCNAHRPRSATAVYWLRRKRNLMSGTRYRPLAMVGGTDSHPDSTTMHVLAREVAAEGDRAYKIALLAAIKAGLETAPIGVVKDRRPLKPCRFEAAPMSYGASPAASCAAN